MRRHGVFMAYAPKILIVDDSKTASLYMAEALRRVGYQVTMASDGREGLVRIFQETPDCLILDVILPGMGGFEVCRQIRAQQALRRLPIIMVSSKNTPLDQAWGLRQGANRYLPKPFLGEVLVQTVHEVLPTHMHLPAASPTRTGKPDENLDWPCPLHQLIPQRR